MTAKVKILAGAILIAAATVLAYLPAIRGGFIWDDPDHVVNNPTLRSFDGLRQMWLEPRSLPQWYPMVHTTFWVEYQLWGLIPLGYHLVNVLLHATSAILLWKLLHELAVPGAALAAAIFALHPIEVESVAWITERKNVLSGLFYVLAMLAYVRAFPRAFAPDSYHGIPARAEVAWAPRPRALNVGEAPTSLSHGLETRDTETHDAAHWGWYIASLLLFFAALFSKTITASLPAAILLVIWWKRGKITLRDMLPLVPFFILGAVMASITAYLEVHHVGATAAHTNEWNWTFFQRCLIACRALWFYAGKLIWPADLAFIYPKWQIDSGDWRQYLYPAGALLAIAVLALARKRLGRGPLVAVLFYCGTILPALGFLNVYPMRYSFVADHFQYHAGAGLIALVAAGIATTLRRIRREQSETAVSCIGAIVLIPLAVLTWNQAHNYHDKITLWQRTLEKNPRSWMVHLNLGHAMLEIDRFNEAEEHYDRALELAPELFEPHVNVGMMHGFRGRYDQAIAALEQSLRRNPQFAPAHFGLGQVYELQNRSDLAEQKYREALKFDALHAPANFRLARMLEQRGELAQAAQHYRAALTGQPDYPEARLNLGNTLIGLTQYDEAIHHLREAVRTNPRFAEAWTSLGGALLLAGRPNEAAAAFERALSINPQLEVARRGLGAAQEASRR